MRDQRLDSPEAFSQRTQLHPFQKSLGAIEAAQIERDHASKSGHLLLSQAVAGMIGQARIINLPHFLLTRKILRDRHTIGMVRLHSNRKRFDSAEDEP